MKIKSAPSTNFNNRSHPVDMLVLHYTGMKTAKAALERMQHPDSKVSSHYLIDEDGEVFQLVQENKRAWHTGVSKWQGDADLNSRSIGIEIANGGWNIPLADGTLPPYRRSQIEAVINLSQSVLSRFKIPHSRIVGHSDIAPDRKDDPGEHFPWEELAPRGIGLWPKINKPNVDVVIDLEGIQTESVIRETQTNLADIGYAIDVSGEPNLETRQVLTAFQRRFLPNNVSGELDSATNKRVCEVWEVYRADATLTT